MERLRWLGWRCAQHLPVLVLPVIAWRYACFLYGLPEEDAHLTLNMPWFKDTLARYGFLVDDMRECDLWLKRTWGLGLWFPRQPLKPTLCIGGECSDAVCGATAMTISELGSFNILLLVGLSRLALLALGVASAWIVFDEYRMNAVSLRVKHWIPRRLLVSIILLAFHAAMRRSPRLRPSRWHALQLLGIGLFLSLKPEMTFKSGKGQFTVSFFSYGYVQSVGVQATVSAAVAVWLRAMCKNGASCGVSWPWPLRRGLLVLSRLTLGVVLVDCSSIRPCVRFAFEFFLGAGQLSVVPSDPGLVALHFLVSYGCALAVWLLVQHPGRELLVSAARAVERLAMRGLRRT